jgi:serine/threonine-protein kinase
LVAQGNYPKACPKFEESLRLDPGIGTQFNLADCWENLGRTASAWALFLDTAAAAQAAVQPERADVARARAVALEPSLPRLVLHVRATTPRVHVTLDGAVMAEPTWGTSIPVDPGPHAIAWREPTGLTGAQRVEIAAGQRRVIEVPAPLTPPSTQASVPTQTQTREAVTPVDDDDGSWRSFALALGAVGIVGVGVGTGYSIAFHSANGAAEAICPERENCAPGDTQRWQDHVDDAKSARRNMFIGFGVGTLAVAGAAVLYLTGRDVSSAETVGSTYWQPNVGADLRSVGVELLGQW